MLCDILTVKTVKRVRSIRGNALVYIIENAYVPYVYKKS